MRLLDFSFEDPAYNLALDEVLLNEAEEGRSGETLRFWESPTPFAVLGVAQILEAEVREELCATDGVPILRRCSAGGCVLQMPGCLNYSLILEQSSGAQLRGIRSSYTYILGSISEALGSLAQDVAPRGISDLASGDLKVSGSAQRRRKRFLLHHGTLLYGADTGLIPRYLKEPEKRPDYRGNRNHLEFVENLKTSGEFLREAIAKQFGGEPTHGEITEAEGLETLRLAREKYSSEAWTRRR